MVQCAKLGRELPGLDYPPLQDELGARIYHEISEEAWKMWLDHATMIINEYQLDVTEARAQALLREQMEKFFFDEGAALPPDYVPPGR